MKVANKLNLSGKVYVGASRATVVCAAIVFAIAGATPSRAQSQQQSLERAMTLTSAATSSSTSTSAAPSAIASTFEYEVASVKLSKTSSTNGAFRFGMRYTDDGLSIENFPLMLLVQQAYGVNKDRISGAPDWLNSERYDIEAKVDPARVDELKKLSPDDLKAARQHMLQVLLADRFKLTLHRETKELAVYNLVVAKGGLKLQETKPVDPDKAANGDKLADGSPAGKKAASAGGPLSVGGGGSAAGMKSVTVGAAGGASVSFDGRGGTRSMQGRAVTIQALTNTLASATGRPVIDKTGLTAKYDYKLEYAPEDQQPDADPTGPSIFTAVQEQLGLKLESAKGPVEIFVIDHVERPSGN
jgi:uncharacterized protein (TIGR03435 family)